MWPFTQGYPQRPLNQLRSQYDFVVIGGGTAGCLLARRLSEDAEFTVLLIERGDASDAFLDANPLLSVHHLSSGKHSTVFDSVEDARLGRSWPLITGFGLGGTSRINGDAYTCGSPSQYNAWHAQGRKGWSYEDMKSYFTKSQNWTGPAPQEYHGQDGPLNVRLYETYTHACSSKIADAAQKIGFHQTADMNSPFEPSTGVNKLQYTLDARGRRHSSFRAFVPANIVAERPNLHICCGVLATKLEFSNGADGLTAEGVELQSYSDRTKKRVVTARHEIVLSCGALRTPQLLLLSGVGPQEHIRSLGLPVVRHTPGVGNYLQDHVLIHTVYNCPLSDSLYSLARQPLTLVREFYRYVRHGTGPFLGFLVETEIFSLSSVIDSEGRARSLTAEEQDPYNPMNVPDIAVMNSTIKDPRTPGADTARGIMGLDVGLMLPTSSGTLRLRSSDPRDHPLCDMQYVTTSKDRQALRAALRITMAMTKQLAADGYPVKCVLTPKDASDASLDKFMDENLGTMYHYSSTCRMAPEDDENPGVVDDELRVHGIGKLRIADGSVLPNCPATHPQAVIYAFAEKCADLVIKKATGNRTRPVDDGEGTDEPMCYTLT